MSKKEENQDGPQDTGAPEQEEAGTMNKKKADEIVAKYVGINSGSEPEELASAREFLKKKASK